jgi:hypothetical protein
VKPKRIQRKRTKGWRMPPNTVCVTRPSDWGNPFRVDCRAMVPPDWLLIPFPDDNRIPVEPETAEEAVALYRLYILASLRATPNLLEPLRGKNLACYCPLDKPCHADVLLELALAQPVAGADAGGAK